MALRLAINGYGRIGRCVVRAFFENPKYQKNIEIAAINDRGNRSTSAHLTRYDSTHGQFLGSVEAKKDTLIINDHSIHLISEEDPERLPWEKLSIDVVLECTGKFTTRDKAWKHIAAGAKKVLISAPSPDADATIVYGVNLATLKKEDIIISNASCTTNCLAPIAKVLHDHIGINCGLMTTIHAVTSDQNLLDNYHPTDVFRARSALYSMIPTKTGAASAIGLVLPDLAGKLTGLAVRVPILNVSLVDFCFQTKRPTTVQEVNHILKISSEAKPLKGILAYNKEPLVSMDYNHNSASSIVDSPQTQVIGDLVKVLAWYDNEWGFSNRLLDIATILESYL